MGLPFNFRDQRFGFDFYDNLQETLETIEAGSIDTLAREGGKPTNTDAANKAVLQSAIAAVESAPGEGGFLVLDADLSYGRKQTDRSTWPNFAGITKPVTLFDFTEGKTYAGYPTAYDGSQLQIWMHTPQTTSLGQHDGNTIYLRAEWAPVWCVSNDMNLTGPRDPLDNRRAGFATMVNGKAYWQWIQGTIVSATATDEELSNFGLQKFAQTGDTIGDYSPYNVERKTSYVSYGGGRNSPRAHHDFEASTGAPANYLVLFDAPGGTRVAWRANGFTDRDVLLKNTAGLFAINTPVGDALEVDYSNRRVAVNAGFKTTAIAPAFGANVNVDCALANSFRVLVTSGIAFNMVNPTNALDGQVIRLHFRNTSGGVMGAVTFGAGYQLAGAFVAPANARNRTYTFEYHAATATFYEVSRSAADVVN